MDVVVYDKVDKESDRLANLLLGTYPQETITDTAIASFDDGADNIPIKSLTVAIEPQQDLHGYDHPWPAGGGVNQWDEEWELGRLSTASGEKITSSNQIRSKNYIPCNAETSYYAVNTTHTGVITCFYNSEKEYLGFTVATALNVDGSAFSTPSNCSYLKFYTYETLTDYTGGIAINFPSTVTTYSPYSNICPITGYTKANVTRTGENLFDITHFFTAADATVFNGTEINLSAGKTLYFQRRGGTYSKLYARKEKDGSDFGICELDVIKASTSLAYDATAIGLSLGAARHYGENDICMVALADFDTIKPYQGSTYSISFPLEAGTVYGGTLDVTTGLLTVDMESAKYDGTEEWYLSSTYRFYMYGQAEILKCSQYYKYQVAIDYASEIPSGTFARAASGVSYIADDRYNSASEWAAHLAELYSAGTPLQVVRKLATPQTYQLDPVTVQTLLGTNNLWSDIGDIKSLIYRADLGKYIDNAITTAVANSLNA